MVAACFVGVLLEHPASPVRELFSPLARRVLAGLTMGATAIAIIYSPWGKQSGAHFNPAVTFTFWRLGKIESWDALFYVFAQFTGAILGVLLSVAVLGALVSHPNVNYAATVPGPWGVSIAFVAELLMAFLMMSMVLRATNTPRIARFTGIFAGILVATFISVEVPVSGMSINPARTVGSAVPARLFTALWLYFLAPALGMLLAAELYRLRRAKVICAKLHHANDKRCIFRCGYGMG
jgi:aquaporin Z